VRYRCLLGRHAQLLSYARTSALDRSNTTPECLIEQEVANVATSRVAGEEEVELTVAIEMSHFDKVVVCNESREANFVDADRDCPFG
jgi:hypothetical protein